MEKGAVWMSGVRKALFLHDNICGGAERVLTSMANHWAARGDEVHLIICGEGDYFPLDSNIIIHQLKISSLLPSALRRISENVKLIFGLSKVLIKVKPEILISFMTFHNIRALIAGLITRTKVMLCERSNPEVQLNLFKRKNEIRAMLLFYRFADLITVQTKACAEYVKKEFAGKAPVEVVMNPLFMPEEIQNTWQEYENEYDFFSMGRLGKAKGYDRLIAAFAEVNKKHPSRLLILGEGPNRKDFEKQIKELNIEDSVFLPGKKSNPWEYMQRSNIFVMTSIYEGLPNAMIEAMALGMPIVSFDFKFGPEELLKGGDAGVLVENGDIKTLSEKMLKLLEDKEQQKELSQKAFKESSKFNFIEVMNCWDRLVDKVISKKADNE